MTPEVGREFLRALGITRVTQSGNWLQCSCPLAPWTHSSHKDSRPSFAVLVDPTKQGAYNCFACGGGSLLDLVLRLKREGFAFANFAQARDISLADETDTPAVSIREYGVAQSMATPLVAFSEIWLASFLRANQVPMAREYLEARGVPEWLSDTMDLRWDTGRRAICFPIRDWTKVLRGLRGRRIEPEEGEPRYHDYSSDLGSRNTSVWFGEHWIDTDKTTVIVESLFDVLKVYPHYPNVMAPMVSGLNHDKLQRINRLTDVLVIPDSDAAGQKMVSQLSRHLQHTPMRIAPLPAGVKDPGDCSEFQIRAIMEKHLI